MLNKRGPKTEPCGTPYFIVSELLTVFANSIQTFLMVYLVPNTPLLC